MGPVWIWAGAAVLYLGFRAWYDGRRRPLTAEEIEGFLARLEGTAAVGLVDREALRAFLERDDGRELVMINLVRLAPEPVPHPETGVPSPARRLLREYLRGFLPALVRRAGHPVLHATKVGPYVDAWNVAPDPGWTLAGCVRYRSRRDLMELATDPRFQAAHPFKAAAMSATFSFPASPGLGLHPGPRIWVGLVLALGAALAQLALG